MRSSSETSDCAICLENKVGLIAELSCGHIYHYRCIEEWVNKKNNVLRCCCICEKNTEIVNIIGEEPEEQKLVNTEQVDDTNYLTYYSNTQSNIYRNNQVAPTQPIINRQQMVNRQQIQPIANRQPRQYRPSYFDLFCCNIL